MNASEMRLTSLLDGSRDKFFVPVYQRPYSWKRDNCTQLLSDLKDVYENKRESHFFGSIVYVLQGRNGYSEHSIIDGQQRFTTISLLLLAIRDVALENPEVNYENIDANDIFNTYLVDKKPKDINKRLKLNLTKRDYDAYEKLINTQERTPNTNITANYNYFYDELRKMSNEQLDGIYDAISKLDIVSICLKPENGDDPQLIFESLNSTGLDLQQIDKIRNLVLMKMNNEDQEFFYQKYWECLEKMCSGCDINAFMRFYLAVKTRQLSNQDRVYIDYKNYQQKCESEGKTVQQILEDMLVYAGFYISAVKPNENPTPYKKVFERFNELDQKTCIPFFMDVLMANKEGKISEEEANKAFELVENYIIRRVICGITTTGYNKMFVATGADVKKIAKEKDCSYYEAIEQYLINKIGRFRFPNNQELKERFTTFELYNGKGNIKKYFLEKLENHNNREKVDVATQLANQELTIEHIMPQTITDEWKTELGESWEAVHSKYVHTIGNLTLTAYNSEYSNQTFRQKRDMPEKGFKYSRLTLNDYVAKCEIWTEQQILERAELLYKKAEEIWWRPEVEVSIEDVEGEWFDWDDDLELMGKTVAGIKLFDTPVRTKNMTDAYIKIIKELYSRNPNVFHDNSYAWFGREPSGLRAAEKISEGAYVEKNKSNDEKLKVIKEITRDCNHASSDICLYVAERNQCEDNTFTLPL